MFQIYERDDGLWDWRLVGSNGEKVATSGGQGFRDKTDAKRGIRDMLGTIHTAAITEFLLDTSDEIHAAPEGAEAEETPLEGA